MRLFWAQAVVERRTTWRLWEGSGPIKGHHGLPLYRLIIIFYLEDGSNTILRNVGTCLPKHTPSLED